MCHVLLKLVPQMTLVESIEVLSRKQVLEGHADRLRENRHVTYHWYPYTDHCVVKRINEVNNLPYDCIVKRINEVNDLSHNGHFEQEDVHNKNQQTSIVFASTKEKPDFAEERERLLKDNPCDRALVASVNLREIAYYRKFLLDQDRKWNPS